MIVEIVLDKEPNLEIEGYEKVDLSSGIVFANPVDKRIEIVIKRHPDGRISIFTDRIDVVKELIKECRVIDIHAK